MKKLLLFFFITFGLTGIANADVEYTYYCEVEGSGFYNYSESQRIDLKPTKLTFRIDRDFELDFWEDILSFNFINNEEKPTGPSKRTFFTMNDYEDYQNFNATLTDETNIFSNLVYKNGSLALTWMNKDSASFGAYFATCTEELMYVLYEDFYTVPKLRCGDLIVESQDAPTIEEIEARDWNNRRAVAVNIDLPPEDPVCIEAQKNNDLNN